MKQVYIYAAGSSLPEIISDLEKKGVKILGIIDANKKKWGTFVQGHLIVGDVSVLKNSEYDEIVVSIIPTQDLMEFLEECGISVDKINTKYVQSYYDARINFVKDWASLIQSEKKVVKVIAEGGVYKGEFAKTLNELFPHSKLYLFDTFEGFAKHDIEIDEINSYSKAELNNHFKDTSALRVKQIMPYPDNVEICKGYFPQTTKTIPEQKWGFVNLDFDLYQPTLEGLRYFYPRLEDHGLLLIHDYFSRNFNGVKKAVYDYELEIKTKLLKLPIGDHFSVAIIKE